MCTCEIAEEDVDLSPAETAKIVHKSVQTLAEWRCTGRYKLPYRKIGGNVWYLKRDVLAFIEKSER